MPPPLTIQSSQEYLNSFFSVSEVRANQKLIRILFFPQHIIHFNVRQGSKNISFYPMVFFAQGLDHLFYLFPLSLSRTRTATGTKGKSYFPGKPGNRFLLQKG